MTKEILNEGNTIVRDEEIGRMLFNLKCRWSDERDYEDFNDYIDVMKSFIEKKGYKFIKLTKSFILTLQGKYETYCLKITYGRTKISIAK